MILRRALRRRRTAPPVRWDAAPADPANESRALLARHQMRLFDRQGPEVRAALASSRFGVPSDIVQTVVQRGPNDAVRAALRERGVMPCEIGTDGVVIETVRQLDRAVARELRSAARGEHPDRLP